MTQGNEPNQRKTKLGTVISILNRALEVLNKHSQVGEGELLEVKTIIEDTKTKISNYKRAKGDEIIYDDPWS